MDVLDPQLLAASAALRLRFAVVAGGPGPGKTTPIARIVATPGGKTVLDQDVPGLVERPEYGLFKGMSMRKLASMSNGKITKQTLDRVSQDLTKLPSHPSPESAPN